VDAAGMTVRIEHPLGAILERSAFELVQTNFRALPPVRWDTSASAPTLLAWGGQPSPRASLRSIAWLAGPRPLTGVPSGLRGGTQEWQGDTVVVPGVGLGDDLTGAGPVAEPLVADDGTLAGTAASILRSERRPEVMARLLNDWIRRSISLEAGPGATRALRTLGRRRGNAAERNLLLVGLARAAGLTARRVWGLALVDGRWQQRGWVELRTSGWMPVDPAIPAVPPGADRIRLATGGETRLFDLVLRAGALRLTVLEDVR
jgi:transglutaminase-like putative cysteine protease